MCTYLTQTADVAGYGYSREDAIRLRRAVVSLDHPRDVPLEHALCIDLRAENGDPSNRLAVELDPASARSLAEAILATLDSDEAQSLR